MANALTSLFAIGIFVLISCGLHALLDLLAASFGYVAGSNDNYWTRLDTWYAGPIGIVYVVLASAFLIAVLFAWRVDINRFSLHDMYKNRLIRCYLGASNSLRKAQPFTGFDANDDIPLKAFRDEKTHVVQRPIHIINTGVELGAGFGELAWQQRKATSFILTPAYCGFGLAKAQGDHGLNTLRRRNACRDTARRRRTVAKILKTRGLHLVWPWQHPVLP